MKAVVYRLLIAGLVIGLLVTGCEPEQKPATTQYKLTVEIHGKGSTSPPEGIHFYDSGTTVTITATHAPGWEFYKWGGDASGTSANSTVSTIRMDRDKVALAHFARRPYLTIDISGQGQTSPPPWPGGSYSCGLGETITLYATPAPGWEFYKWGGDASGNSTLTTVTMDRDKHVIAHFTRIQYKLTVEIHGKGSISPPEGSYTYDSGTNVTLYATPAPGWKLYQWIVLYDVSRTSPSTTVTMDENKKVIAHFTKIEYDLFVDIDGKGSTSPPEGLHFYDPGTKVTLTATPAPGWEFYKWGGDAQGTSTITTVTMDRNRSVMAYFQGLLELSSSGRCDTKWVGQSNISTVHLTYSATDKTNGERLVTRVVVTLDGKEVADSGPISQVTYKNHFSFVGSYGAPYEFVITATNAGGRTFVGKAMITCPEEGSSQD